MRPVAIAAAATLAALACSRPPEVPAGDAGGALAVPVGRRPFDVAVGDLDRDGKPDLVTANGDKTLSIRLQRDGGWAPAPGDPLPAADSTHMVALADVDGDGDLDAVATSHDAGGVWLWLGDGTGRLAPAAGSPFAAVEAERPHNHGLVVGDLDGDGDADVVVGDQTAQQAVVLLGDGRGALTRPGGGAIDLGAQTYPPSLGDVDGDGHLDLVAPLISGPAIGVLLGDGRGGFHPAPGSPTPSPLPRPYAIALTDLDGDGALDAIAAHDDTDRISVWLGDGHGRLRAAPGSPLALGRRIWRMATVDVDGDGAVDVIGAGSGSLFVIPGDGHGGLGRPRVEPLGEGWMVVSADFDGDGRPDLAAPDGDAGVVRIWLGRGPARQR